VTTRWNPSIEPRRTGAAQNLHETWIRKNSGGLSGLEAALSFESMMVGRASASSFEPIDELCDGDR
jgi:hypothetical protein